MRGERFEKAETGVFWDAEECKIPSGLNVLSVSKNIRTALKDTSFHGLTSIFVYGSTEDIMLGLDSSAGRVVNRKPAALDYKGAGDIYENESPDIISRSEHPPAVRTGLEHKLGRRLPAVVMNPTRPGDKGQRYGAFFTGVFSWALDHAPPANLILVVGDVAEHMYRFIGAFSHLNAGGFNVAFVQPENRAAPELFYVGRRVWPWEKLTLGQGPIPKLRPEPRNSSVVSRPPNFNLLGVGGLACFLIDAMQHFWPEGPLHERTRNVVAQCLCHFGPVSFQVKLVCSTDYCKRCKPVPLLKGKFPVHVEISRRF